MFLFCLRSRKEKAKLNLPHIGSHKNNHAPNTLLSRNHVRGIMKADKHLHN